MRLLWLADVLRAAGLTVVEHVGWQSRGFQPWEPRYGIVHATAAPRTQTDAAQVAIVRDGRTGLAGPIANACVDRSGRWHVLAAGRCNTALQGWGGPAAGLGNENLLGVEACNDNGLHQPPEVWPKVQYDSYARGWAALCRRLGWPASRLIGHKEHQPNDKSDPLFSMSTFRALVAHYIEEGDMPTVEEYANATADEVIKRLTHKAQAGDTAVKRGAQTAGQVIDPHKALQYAWAYPELIDGAVQKIIIPQLAELEGQIAGLTALVQQLTTAPSVQLTEAQLQDLTEAVSSAARAPGERIAAALGAAGDAISGLDDNPGSG